MLTLEWGDPGMTQEQIDGRADPQEHLVEIVQRARGDDTAYWRCTCGQAPGPLAPRCHGGAERQPTVMASGAPGSPHRPLDHAADGATACGVLLAASSGIATGAIQVLAWGA